MSDNNLQRQLELTRQSATGKDNLVSAGLLFWLVTPGQIIAPWWSKRRDVQLRSKWKDSDHLSGAYWNIATKLSSVPFHTEPRDMSVKAHVRLAEVYQDILERWVQFGKGWQSLWSPAFVDLWSQDNGMFIEVIGEGPSNAQIKGPAIGLSTLDSYRCMRTSNPEFPVIYDDTDGKRYKYHHSRVIFISQLPSPATEMNGVGFCWLSRAINKTQELIDQSVYKQEKLGSRPHRGMLVGKGIDTSQIIEAVHMAEEGMDNQGLSRFAKMIVLGSLDPNFDIELKDFASLPDGFNEKTSTELAMNVIALTGGFPIRWLWPASTVGATKADAFFQHVAGSGSGAAWHLTMMRHQLEHKFLPPQLKIIFDFQDDEQDRMQAQIRDMRAMTRNTNLETGISNIRIERERALAAGDLTKSQFAELELESGRLPSGDSVLILFKSSDDLFTELLNVGVADPLAVNQNNAETVLNGIENAVVLTMEILVNNVSTIVRAKIKQALAALAALEELYTEDEEVEEEEPVIQEEEIIEGKERIKPLILTR